jgi:hypothetical protein
MSEKHTSDAEPGLVRLQYKYMFEEEFGEPCDEWLDSCWGLVLKCFELRTRQHKKVLSVKVLRPSKHYVPLGNNESRTKVMRDIPS